METSVIGTSMMGMRVMGMWKVRDGNEEGALDLWSAHHGCTGQPAAIAALRAIAWADKISGIEIKWLKYDMFFLKMIWHLNILSVFLSFYKYDQIYMAN